MVSKRGRKRTTEEYFGPKEEEAVIKYLSYLDIKTLDFVRGKSITIEHNLGPNISVDAVYSIPNENAYGSDSKTIEIELPLFLEDNTDTSIVVTSDISVDNVTVIIADTINRDLVFNEWLREPLYRMVEAIIHRYKLHRKGVTFEDLHGDTLSFLMTKVHKFEPDRGKKAYSYFGTIAKHYILGLLIKDDKYMKQNYSYEDMSNSIEEREDLTYVIDNDGFVMDDFIQQLSNGIKDELDDENQPPKKKLNDNERKVGLALIEILENWETAFESMEGGSKYNKNSVLETMRNYTNLSTKDIRLAMKRFKDMYELLKMRGL